MVAYVEVEAALLRVERVEVKVVDANLLRNVIRSYEGLMRRYRQDLGLEAMEGEGDAS